MMKTFVELLLIIMLPSISLSDETIFDSFDYYRVLTNYNGSAYNGNSILVYGEGGVIVRSTDGGNSWQQINLNDSFNIMSITNIGANFFGVVNKNYIIKSTDNGESWQQFYYSDNTEFYKILSYNNNLYCLSNSKIYVLNQDIQKIKEYSVETDTTYYDFTITGNNIIYSAGHGKLGKINLQNDYTSFIDLKAIGICSNCPVLKNLFSDGNITYFNYYNDLYQYDGSKVERIFTPIKKGLFTANNGDVFEIYNVTYTDINLDSLFFVRIDKSSKKAIQIKMPGNDRYITNLKFTNINFITNDLIIAVGKDKLIYVSYNRGINWNLKSHFTPGTVLFRHDEFNANGAYRYAKFLKTNDGGVTWKPQKNYNPYYINDEFKDPWNFGKIFFSDIYSGFVFRHTMIQNEINFAFTNDGCETVNLKNENDIIGWDNAKGFITFVNNNITFFIFPVNWGIKGWHWSLVFTISNNLDVERLTRIDSAWIIFMDTFQNEKMIGVIENLKYPRKINDYKYTFDSVYYSLISSIDNGNTWNKELDFYIPDFDTTTNIGIEFKGIYKVKDNILFSYTHVDDDSTNFINDIYLLNVKSKVLNKIFTKQGLDLQSQGFGLACVGNKVYLNGVFWLNPGIKLDILVNDDIDEQPSEWRSISPKTRYGMVSILSHKDSLITIAAYDSLFKSTVIWFAKPKPATSTETQVEDLYTLYLSNSKPNPAQEFTRIKVWWDQRNDIEHAHIKVYNIMGQIVSNKYQFNFNRINAYSGEFTWNCSTYTPGVYLITITLGGESRTKTVVINR